jgi:hypothetical protein
MFSLITFELGSSHPHHIQLMVLTSPGLTMHKWNIAAARGH